MSRSLVASRIDNEVTIRYIYCNVNDDQSVDWDKYMVDLNLSESGIGVSPMFEHDGISPKSTS